MDPSERTAIRRCRVRLVNDLMIDDMFDSIESRSLFTPIMLECIKAKESRPEKVRTFLDYLQRRGPGAFDQFIQCLRESDHNFVASYVLQEYLSQRNSLTQNSLNNSQGPAVSMSNNVYLTQETQRSSQGQVSRSVEEPQGSGDTEMREDVMVEDNEGDAIMVDEPPQSGVQESQSSIPGSTSQGTCSSTSGPQSSLHLRSFSNQVSSVGTIGYTGNSLEEYKMETDPRGLLLIINNRKFQGDLSERLGTDIDCDSLKTLFMSLGFGVDVRNNLTAYEIKENLHSLSQHQQLTRVDSLAVALLTHGTEDYLYGVDGRYINVNEAFESFTAEKCPALHHKPKFFIINACRGDLEDKGSMTRGEHETVSISHDVRSMPPEPRSSSRIPNMKDFLVAYSTIPGHVSWRHLNDGSFFIQGFVKIFREYASMSDVLKMLVKVNDQVSRNISHQGVQIPAPQVMLTKTWFLNPITRPHIQS